MSANRLPDYLDPIQQAATDACSFVEGLAKNDFLADNFSCSPTLRPNWYPSLAITEKKLLDMSNTQILVMDLR